MHTCVIKAYEGKSIVYTTAYSFYQEEGSEMYKEEEDYYLLVFYFLKTEVEMAKY